MLFFRKYTLNHWGKAKLCNNACNFTDCKSPSGSWTKFIMYSLILNEHCYFEAFIDDFIEKFDLIELKTTTKSCNFINENR